MEWPQLDVNKRAPKEDLGLVRDPCHQKLQPEILAVEREMQQVRRDVQARGSAMVASARAITDWKHHVRSHPWMLLGISAVAGYFLIPRRPRTSQEPSVASAETSPLTAATAPNVHAGPGLGGVATRMLRDALLRAGMAFFEREVTRQLTEYASRRRQKDSNHDPISN